MTCHCRLCARRREIAAIVETGTREQLVATIRELQSDLCSAEEDQSYYRAILDGSWPTATQQLCDALGNAVRNKKGAA